MDRFKKSYYIKFFWLGFFLLTSLCTYKYWQKPSDMAWIPGGDFIMGNNSSIANQNEKPAHKVHVNGFWMDKTDVTNAQFALFVEATGYITTAEQKPDWETIKAQVLPGTPKPSDESLIPGAMVFIGTNQPVPLTDSSIWWQFIPGTDWRHPTGPESSIIGKDDYPVVQISYEDVLAYARWIGKSVVV